MDTGQPYKYLCSILRGELNEEQRSASLICGKFSMYLLTCLVLRERERYEGDQFKTWFELGAKLKLWTTVQLVVLTDTC